MHLALHELGHIATFAVFVLPIFLATKKIFAAKNYLIGLAVTLFLDLDHLIDYFMYKGIGFNVSEFLSGIYFHASQKVLVFFHSWELAAILLGVYFLQKRKHAWLLFVFVGIAAHLIFDTVYYGFNLDVYFLLVRIFNGFNILVFS